MKDIADCHAYKCIGHAYFINLPEPAFIMAALDVRGSGYTEQRQRDHSPRGRRDVGQNRCVVVKRLRETI